MSDRLSICIAHNCGPGGALRFVEETARRLAANDDVVVCTWGPEPDPQLDGVEQLWIPAPSVPSPAPLRPFADLARSVVGSTRAAKVIDRSGFDAVLMNACRWAQAPAGLRSIRTPTVYVAHEGRRRSAERGYRPSGIERTGWRRRVWAAGTALYDGAGGALDRRAMRAEVTFATSSRWTAQNLHAAYGIDPSVVEPGVDTALFRPPPARAVRRDVLVVGALDPTKRPDLAIAAVARLPREQRPDVRLVYNRFSPAYAERLDRLAAELGVTVIHRRAVSDDELVAEYGAAAVVVACAVAEPFGLTIPEASACGTPVVAVDEGGYRETVSDGSNGLLVAPTADGIAGGLATVLGSDRFDHAAIAAAAQRRWSWNRCAQDVRRLCASAASGASPTREQGVVGFRQ